MDLSECYTKFREYMTNTPRRGEYGDQRLAEIKPARLERVHDVRDKTIDLFDIFETFYKPPASETDLTEHTPKLFTIYREQLHTRTCPEDLIPVLAEQGLNGEVSLGSLNGTAYNPVIHRAVENGLETEQADAIQVTYSPRFKTKFLNANYFINGEYGEAFNAQLATALGYIGTQIATHQQAFSEVDKMHAHSFGRSADNDPRDSVGSLTLWEGAITIAQTLNLLSQHKIDGYEDPAKLATNLVDSGSLLKFVKAVPVGGLIGPLVLSGTRIQQPVQCNNEGALRLSSRMLEAFDAHMHESQLDRRLYYEKVLRDIMPFMPKKIDTLFNGAGCPAAYSRLSDTSPTRNVVHQMAKHFVHALSLTAK